MSSAKRRTATLLAAAVSLFAAATAQARTDGSRPISIGVYSAITSVPAATLDAVGADNVAGPAQFGVARFSGKRLMKNGKPQFIAASLAWCPHCAANSWAITVALLRFGTFAKLRTIDTGTFFAKQGGKPPFSHTKGLSFLNSGYESEYLTFTPIIAEDLKGETFQTPTKAQARALKFSKNGFPATNIGGLYGTVGSGYGPEYLRGAKLTHQQIANAIHKPSTAIAKRIGGLANFFSAAICELTGGQPADVCTSPGVQAGKAKLPTG